MGKKLGVRGKKCVECVVCPRSVLNVVRFAAERLRARPIGFSVRVSMVPLPAPGPLEPEARIIPLDQAADCRMFFFCSSTDENRSNEASLSPRAVLTDDTATVLLSSPRWEDGLVQLRCARCTALVQARLTRFLRFRYMTEHRRGRRN